jgi:SAM-dependent methyltransferase
MANGKFPKRNYAPRNDRPKVERPRRPAPPVRKAAAPAPLPAAPTAWEKQADWYDRHQGDSGSDFYNLLIVPAVLRQLGAKPGQSVLDVGCGQGILGRALAAAGVGSVGVDASPSLIEAARARAGSFERYLVGDVRALAQVLSAQRFDHAVLVLCLQDIDRIEPVLQDVAKLLKTGGRCVIVLTHPCFRIPKRSGWGFDEEWGIQYRRVDAYLTSAALPIKTHPGKPSDTSATTSFHRPLSAYIDACGKAGLGIVAAEELCSHRRGSKGSRSSAEDRAAKEIPVFMVLTAVAVAK